MILRKEIYCYLSALFIFIIFMLQNKLSDLPDNTIEKAKKFDPEALSNLCTHYYPKIFRYVFYKVKTREEAEDITNEVFARMVKNINKQRDSFQAWLFRIASNLVVDYYRSNTNKNNILQTENQLQPLQNIKNNDLDGIYLLKNLKQLLFKLTEEQQKVIILKFFEGYNNQEIADIMNKSIGAIKALQFRALIALKKLVMNGN